jgi:hypothetical protein
VARRRLVSQSFTSKHARQQVYLDFDGVMAFPKIYVNDERPVSGTILRVPNRHHQVREVWQANVVAVRCDTTAWQRCIGAGIYRSVS